jgi:hypothetical protein
VELNTEETMARPEKSSLAILSQHSLSCPDQTFLSRMHLSSLFVDGDEFVHYNFRCCPKPSGQQHQCQGDPLRDLIAGDWKPMGHRMDVYNRIQANCGHRGVLYWLSLEIKDNHFRYAYRCCYESKSLVCANYVNTPQYFGDDMDLHHLNWADVDCGSDGGHLNHIKMVTYEDGNGVDPVTQFPIGSGWFSFRFRCCRECNPTVGDSCPGLLLSQKEQLQLLELVFLGAALRARAPNLTSGASQSPEVGNFGQPFVHWFYA